jgi:hypothetical protein
MLDGMYHTYMIWHRIELFVSCSFFFFEYLWHRILFGSVLTSSSPGFPWKQQNQGFKGRAQRGPPAVSYAVSSSHPRHHTTFEISFYASCDLTPLLWLGYYTTNLMKVFLQTYISARSWTSRQLLGLTIYLYCCNQCGPKLVKRAFVLAKTCTTCNSPEPPGLALHPC